MDKPLSDRWSWHFYKKLCMFIDANDKQNAGRVESVTPGLVMPDIANVAIGSGKRMTASVLFFDLADFSRITHLISRDDTLRILNLIIPTVMRIARNWNGEIEKNTGDGIMAIFGTRSRDKATIARDAVECAMAIRYTMVNEIQQRLSRQNLPSMNFRIGIDMDELLIARIGINNNSFLSAVGDAANRASKLQSLAEANGISIGEYVFHNLHTELHKYCDQGSHPSWEWTIRDTKLEYRFFHFRHDWVEPLRGVSLKQGPNLQSKKVESSNPALAKIWPKGFGT